MGLCAGGIVAICASSAHLAATASSDRIAGLTLGVCVLDNEQRRARPARFMDTADGGRGGRRVRAQGLPRRPRARGRVRLAAPERPDLELLGQQLPAGQGPAGLRHPLLERRHDEPARRRCTATSWSSSLDNALVRAGRARRCSARRSTCRRSPSTPTSWPGIADHITPWQNAYRIDAAARLRAALRALHQRPHRRAGQPAGQREGELPGQRREPARGAEAWLRERDARHQGTWWDDWSAWLGERSGAEKPARKRLGGKGYKPLDPAPGTLRAGDVPASRRLYYERHGARRAAAADHRLHDQRGGVRAGARPLRRALRVHHLRQPRLGALGRPLRRRRWPSWPPTRRGLLTRAAASRSAHVYGAVDGRDGRPGARAPLPGARARAGARRHDAGRPVRAAAAAGSTCSAIARGGRATERGLRAAAAVLAEGSAASSPSACASCCGTSPRTALGRRRSARTGGRTRLPRHGVAARRGIQAPTLVMHGERDAMARRQRAAAGARIPTPSWPRAGAGHASARAPAESFAAR